MKILVAMIIAAMLVGCGSEGAPLSPSSAGRSTALSSTYKVLYSFKGGNDGRDPHGGPLIKVRGKLYGTTEYGGGPCHSRCFGGTVYAITTSGSEKVIHSFEVGSGDGKNPRAGLIDVAGTLYGVAVHGGTAQCYCGAVFKVTLSGAETVLHSFTGGSSDGDGPDADLLEVNGTLYGTTINGGKDGDGTVFAIAPSGTESVVYNFTGKPDGAHPYAPLVDVNGTLYGTTVDGGADDLGTVFAIAPSGAQNVIYSFKGGTKDGEHPVQADLLDVNGTLYGTTSRGGTFSRGTLFSIAPSGTETVLHSFGAQGDGALPYGDLLDVNGTLYGTTSNGGTGSCLRYGNVYGCGTVFQATPSGTETVLHSFNGLNDGRFPYMGLIDVNGTFYGTTTAGGSKDDGAVFTLSP